MIYPTISLSEVAHVFNGKTPSKLQQRESGHPVLKIKDVSQDKRFRGAFKSFVDKDVADKFESKHIQLNDTLILNAAHNADYVGSKQYRAEQSVVDSLPTGEWLIVRSKNENTTPIYINYWFRTGEAKFNIRNLVKGIHLYPKDVSRLKIPLPPLVEQQKIAAILDAADSLRQKDQQLIDHYTTLSQSLFLEMFGDPVTNPMGWDKVLFGDVGKLDRGKSKHRPRNDPKLLGGSHPLIQTGDVANSGGYITEYTSTYSDIGLEQSKKWNIGTLCITIAANIAKTGVLTFAACFPDSVVGFISNKKTNIEYVQYWLSFLQKTLEETAPMAAQKNINLKILRELDIPLPPIELQNQFADRIQAIESQKQQAQAGLEKSNDLFNSLLQRAFSGELTGSKVA